MCEPLRGKKPKEESFLDEFEKGCNQGYETCLEDTKSAVEFYKKYRDAEILLREEQPGVFDCWYKQICDEFNCEVPEKYYNDWLLDYCFQDVIS